MKFNKRILYLIEQSGSLLSMPRSHTRSLGNTFDNIASHSHLVSIIAYIVARMEKLSHNDAQRALAMGAFHDLSEARTGDLDFIAKNYTKDNEEKAVLDQFKNIDFEKDLLGLLKEFEDRKSLASKCAKDADSLAQLYLEWALMWRGNKLAENWFKGDFIARVPHFYTKSAKQIAKSMKSSNPNEWWWTEFVTKKGMAKNINHLMGKNYK